MSRVEGQSTEAQHRPVGRPRKEVHTGDMPTRELPSIALPDVGVVVREAESIVVSDDALSPEYLAELAFNEELVTIRLERPAEKNAAPSKDFSVNDKTVWIKFGVPTAVPRKYVEVIARSQPYDVETRVEDESGEHPRNEIVRFARTRFPFSVIHDPSPRGYDWLTQLMQSA